jgi:hypothetical protein
MTCNESVLSIDAAREKALVWKQDLRVVPLSAFIYLLCYLDRSNIGEHLGSTQLLARPYPLIFQKEMPKHSMQIQAMIWLLRQKSRIFNTRTRATGVQSLACLILMMLQDCLDGILDCLCYI